MSTVSLLRNSELAFGQNRRVVWIDDPADATGTPQASVSAGQSTDASVSGDIIASQRHVAGKRSAFYKINRATFSSAYSYAITVEGDAYSTTGQTSAEAAVTALATAINAAAVADGDPRAAAIPGGTDGVIDTLHVWAADVTDPGDAGLAITNASTTAPDGMGVDAWCYVEPVSFRLRVWVLPKSPAELPVQIPWTLAAQGDYGDVPLQGVVLPVSLSGQGRVYAEIYEVEKDAADTETDLVVRPFLAYSIAIPEE